MISNLHRSSPSASTSCAVCGCHELELDQVVDAGLHLELGECGRCGHRFTRTLPASPAPRALPPIESVFEAFPNAA